MNAADGVDTALLTTSMGMGIAGVRLLFTIIEAPVLLGLEEAALACGLLSGAGKVVSRRLALKAKIHDEIRVLALGKLRTIADHVSTAMINGEISSSWMRSRSTTK